MDALQRHVVEFYSHFFAADPGSGSPFVDGASIPCIMVEERRRLEVPVRLEAVRAAVFSMKALKAPGTDRIQPIFYQRHWSTLGSTLLSFVHDAFLNDLICEDLLKSHLVLIPKFDSP